MDSTLSLNSQKQTAMIYEELTFWKRNLFDILYHGRIPQETPDIQTARQLAAYLRRKRDYYAVMRRIKELQNAVKPL
ncbi:MAG: hypothetical protein JKX95_07210 [Bacteroidia bacterium]|nr:hypothetical protein [Bacteroidia bacterium]